MAMAEKELSTPFPVASPTPKPKAVPTPNTTVPTETASSDGAMLELETAYRGNASGDASVPRLRAPLTRPINQ
jgi:hypothetical protein